MGDPLGIGPEVIIKSLNDLLKNEREVQFDVIGLEDVFFSLPDAKDVLSHPRVAFHQIQSMAPLSPQEAGRLSWECLKHAVQFIKKQECQALVTAPICKEHIQMAGFPFPGHTEYLCHEFGVSQYAMMLFHSRLRVVLMTIHEPLKEIFSKMTAENLQEKLRLTQEALHRFFNIEYPKIAVCGLNPHAGEHGRIGKEEEEIIKPTIEALKQDRRFQNSQITGPYPADTVFYEALQGKFDAVLCHYHDQALIPLKTTGFDEGVNMTLGLPFIRTSPDHGTAFDIVGKNLANPKSMRLAIETAMQSV